MNEPGRLSHKPSDPANERRAWGPSFVYLVMAAGVVIGGLLYWWTLPPTPEPFVDDSAAQSPWPASAGYPAPAAPVRAASAASAASASASVAARPAARMRDPNGDQTPDLTDYLNAGEKPKMGEVIDRLHQAGVYTGVGAFNPPGTRPPLMGLAVPEDFVLPPGYVRHSQATDDGQRIEPILMYSPDYQEFVDAAGRPITIPKNRVVAPEHAPPGMPIRRIVIPAPLEP